ncbi:TspO/MBR family protein [Dysgonomonas sp. ZJ279]|uniref:TspO/MBR family protein n=1 Tax=Dysgonomonas sp. ZJ279 TaxID=2709796 RepID=UPI0013EC211F|nr:TspO/MBR family protein [Dysgonomonas sp. ZJ279]
MRNILIILIPIIICFLVGCASQNFQEDSMVSWYPYLCKSPLTPHNIVFPVAWSLLYLLMGLSIGLFVISDKAQKKYFILLFALQLFFNFTWSIAFFYLENPLLGLINIILLDFLIIYYAIKMYPVSKISSILFFPYILWVGFATYLNLYIFLYN